MSLLPNILKNTFLAIIPIKMSLKFVVMNLRQQLSADTLEQLKKSKTKQASLKITLNSKYLHPLKFKNYLEKHQAEFMHTLNTEAAELDLLFTALRSDVDSVENKINITASLRQKTILKVSAKNK